MAGFRVHVRLESVFTIIRNTHLYGKDVVHGGSALLCLCPPAMRARYWPSRDRRWVTTAVVTMVPRSADQRMVVSAVQAVGPCHSREALKVDLLRQPAEGAVAHLRRLVQNAKLKVMRHQPDDLCSHVEAVDRVDVQAMAEARSPRHHRRSRCAAVVSAGRHLVPGTPVELASALALENRRDPSLR